MALPQRLEQVETHGLPIFLAVEAEKAVLRKLALKR